MRTFPFSLPLIGGLFFLLISCTETGRELKDMDPAAHAYVLEHSAGIVSASSEVVVRLAEDLAIGIEPGTELEEEVFTFRPAVNGKVVWKSSNALAFLPDEPLASGTLYEVTFHLGKLKEVPAVFRDLAFNVQTIEQGFELREFRLNPYSQADFTWNRLQATLIANDVSSIDEVSKRIALEGIASDRIQWESDAGAKVFTVNVDSMQRVAEEQVFVVTDRGEPLDTLVLPSISDFRMLDQLAVQLPNQELRLFFSSPVASRQRFDGMFQINGVDVEDVEVSGTLVTLRPAEPIVGDVAYRVAQGLRSSRGEALSMDWNGRAFFNAEKPAVRFASSGNIVAGTGDAVVPIAAVNLRAVDVRVYQIYENNVHQFFQANAIGGDDALRSVARPIAERRLELDGMEGGRWENFGLDLDQIVEREPGAIYRLELGFRPSYSLYPCTEVPEDPEVDAPNPDRFDEDYWDPWRVPGYRYSERDNPCHVSYYTADRKVRKNVLVSDVGLIVKSGGEAWYVYVTDLSSGAPQAGAQVEFRNYQGQQMARATTDATGKATLPLDGTPFLAIATIGEQKAYLKLERGASLSVSAFEVGGEQVEDGIQGFLYAERGIWHPGDSIHLDAILDDSANPLPPDHPLVLNVYSPSNQLIQRKVLTRGTGSIFNLGFFLDQDVATGRYRAELVVGSKAFSKSLSVESIQPNRLDVRLEAVEAGMLEVKNQGAVARLSAEWLTGAKAPHLRYEIKGALVRDAQAFKEAWPRYAFFNDLQEVSQLGDEVLAEGELNGLGQTIATLKLGNLDAQPGPLRFKSYTRVYEPSGRFSVATHALPLHPHAAYVGIQAPEEGEQGWLNTNESHDFGLVRVDPQGRLAPGRVKVDVYGLTWNWWWSRRNGQSTYLNSDAIRLLSSQEIQLTSGQGRAGIEVKDADWGRVLVVVTDLEGSHQATAYSYFDWSNDRDRSERASEEGAGVIAITLDKERYEVGETVTLKVPSAAGGRLLLSLENGRDQVWDQLIETDQGTTTVRFPLTAEMSPTIYAHAMIIQPFDGKANDLPLRLYGISPIEVVDPDRRLEVEVSVPEEVKPNTTLEVSVSERSGAPMEYTLAVVDEGLLGLTNFKTPDPHAAFSKRQALGVRTWDVYEWVMNAFGGRLERVLAVGGDAALLREQEDNSDRFKSVVAHLGPFTLDAGKQRTHQIPIQNYLGNVRVMVVAANADRAVGSAHANVRVKQDLMAQLTVPRQLAPEETVVVPVTVFAMRDGLGTVDVQVKSNDLVEFESDEQRVTFREEGQQTLYFRGKVRRAVGTATFTATARSARLTSTDEQRVVVRHPLAREHASTTTFLDAEPLELQLTPMGIPTSNTAVVEISQLPSLRLTERIEYLMGYPHGCTEQITSRAFAQLYVGDWMELDAAHASAAREHVVAAMNALRTRQLPDGGFRYWPSSTSAHEWASTYVGHFLVMAEQRGFDLPVGMLKSHLSHERKAARNWTASEGSSDQAQAYRLYVLALAQQPELGAMTRLMNRSALSNRARFTLAAAYAAAGEVRWAQELLGACTLPGGANRFGYATFGSPVRDLAMWVDALHRCGRRDEAVRLGLDLAEALGTGWRSTQEIAFGLNVLSEVFEPQPDAVLDVEVGLGGTSQRYVSDRRIVEVPVPDADRVQSLSVRCSGGCFVTVTRSGVPVYGEESARQSGLEMVVTYFDANGNPMDPSSVRVGSTMRVRMRVKRTKVGDDFERLACTVPLADGWEVTNTRLSGGAGNGGVEHEDFRDDRVLTYFDLAYGNVRELEFELIATYPGRFYLPGVRVEGMYDLGMQAVEAGSWVVVREN